MICTAEGISPADGVLDRVARMARGSLRDAESLLDQLVAYCGDNIELEVAREVLGLIGEEAVPDFADSLQSADLVRGFRLIDGLSSTGADLRHFARELVDYLRALVVVKTGAETSLLQEYRADELAKVRAASQSWDYRRLLGAIRSFGDLDGKIKQEAFGQVQLEMAFMECALFQDASLSAATTAPVTMEHIGQATISTSSSNAGATSLPIPSSLAQAMQVSEAEKRDPPASDQAEVTIVQELHEEVPPAILDLASVRANWSRLLSEIRGSGSIGIATALQGGDPLSVSGNTIALGFDEKPLWKNTLERPGAREKVETALSSVFGTKVAVRFQYGLKVEREALPPRQDPVVEAAVRELGFRVSRVEPSSD